MKKYNARAEHDRRCHEIAARNDALAGVVPEWHDRPDLPAFIGQELPERPLHGVPSVFRKCLERRTFDRLESMEMWGAAMLQHVAECAGVIGDYTRHLRTDRQRTAAIWLILRRAGHTKFPQAEHVELHNVRAWMHVVCQEALPWVEAR